MIFTPADLRELSALGVTLEAMAAILEKLQRHGVAKNPLRSAMTPAQRAKKYRDKRKPTVTETAANVTIETVTEPVIFPQTPLEKTPSFPVVQVVLKEESKVITREDEQGFPELWAIFPKRAGNNPRKPALQSYLRAIKKGATVTEICDGALRYAATCDARSRFTKQCVTWLNNEGWKDDYSIIERPRQSELMDAGDRLIDRLQNGGRGGGDAERDGNQNGLFDPVDSGI